MPSRHSSSPETGFPKAVHSRELRPMRFQRIERYLPAMRFAAAMAIMAALAAKMFQRRPPLRRGSQTQSKAPVLAATVVAVEVEPVPVFVETRIFPERTHIRSGVVATVLMLVCVVA